MPGRAGLNKLTLTVTDEMNAFLNERSASLGITVSEYQRRLIGVASIYATVKDEAIQNGYDSMLAFAPAFPSQAGAEKIARFIIPDLI